MCVLLFKRRHFRRSKHPHFKIRGTSNMATKRRYQRRKKKKIQPNQRRLTPSCKLSADAVVVGGWRAMACEGDQGRQVEGRELHFSTMDRDTHTGTGAPECFKKQCFSSIFSQSCYSVAESRFFNLHLSALAIHTQINGTEEDSRGF